MFYWSNALDFSDLLQFSWKSWSARTSFFPLLWESYGRPRPFYMLNLCVLSEQYLLTSCLYLYKIPTERTGTEEWNHECVVLNKVLLQTSLESGTSCRDQERLEQYIKALVTFLWLASWHGALYFECDVRKAQECFTCACSSPVKCSHSWGIPKR
jgi:hypothetical protein